MIAKHGCAKSSGKWLNHLTSGILSARPAAGLGVLASVNAGIEALGRTLALELAPRRVNTVCPGFIDSGKLWKDLPAEEREAKMRDKAASDLLTVRVGLPDDAATQAISAERVVSETLRAFDKKQAVLVPGTLTTRIQAFAHRVLPRTVVARIAASVSTKILTNDNKRKESSNVTSQP